MESRMETYLNAAISGNTENLPNPISRIDFLLCELIKTLGESGASIEEVEKIVTDKVAEIVADAPEDFNTLKELSDWIYTHEESAAAMNTAIQTNTNSIESLLTDVNKKANSDDVYNKTTADSRFLGIDATADKAVADENGSNISETFSTMKNDITINRTTLGTQSKNLLKIVPRTITSGGVTCVIDDDGIVTVNGTASETVFINIRSNISLDETLEYTLTGTYDNSSYGYIYYQLAETTGGDNRYNDFGNGVTFKGTCGSVSLRIPAGAVLNNVKYYPMLRYADITDSTYESHKESVDERLIENKSNAAVNRSTLGYQCKNLLKNNAVTQTVSGVTFTVNSDGSVTVNGTNTSSSTGANLEICSFKNYGTSKLTASLNSTDSNLYMSVFDKSWVGIGFVCDEEVTWDNGNKERLVRLVVKPGATINNVTVYPMIRYADITDDAYEPYKESVDERLIKNKSDIAINKSTLGTQCKNLLKNNAVTQTVSGVTFTINDDKSITVNGTATAQISFIINNKVGLGIGNYILTGCPSGGSWNTFYLTAYASSEWLSAPDFGSGCKIENKTVTQVVITIASGYTANNLKFYPMLRDADIIDDTYEPYQPSLYEQIVALEERIAALEV